MDKAWQPIDSMSIEELKKELTSMRNMFSWLPENVQHDLSRIGSDVRVVTRNFSGHLGVFLGASYSPKEFDVEVVEIITDFNDMSKRIERKVLRIPVSNVIQFEYLNEVEDIVEHSDVDNKDNVEDWLKESYEKGGK